MGQKTAGYPIGGGLSAQTLDAPMNALPTLLGNPVTIATAVKIYGAPTIGEITESGDQLGFIEKVVANHDGGLSAVASGVRSCLVKVDGAW